MKDIIYNMDDLKYYFPNHPLLHHPLLLTIETPETLKDYLINHIHRITLMSKTDKRITLTTPYDILISTGDDEDYRLEILAEDENFYLLLD